jgi:hypothetical protein
VEKVRQAAVASARLGLKAHATFSGALAWPFFIRGRRIISRFDEAFDELARRWRPLLDVSTNRASMSATKSIPAKTCTMA